MFAVVFFFGLILANSLFARSGVASTIGFGSYLNLPGSSITVLFFCSFDSLKSEVLTQPVLLSVSVFFSLDVSILDFTVILFVLVVESPVALFVDCKGSIDSVNVVDFNGSYVEVLLFIVPFALLLLILFVLLVLLRVFVAVTFDKLTSNVVVNVESVIFEANGSIVDVFFGSCVDFNSCVNVTVFLSGDCCCGFACGLIEFSFVLSSVKSDDNVS